MRNSWEASRTEFNHDWLKNKFLPALGKALNLIDGKIKDEMFEKTFLESTLSQWDEKQKEAEKIILEFFQGVSPKIFFQYAPLANLDESSKECLSEVVHKVWLNRYQVKKQVDMALQTLENAKRVYSKLQDCLSNMDVNRNWTKCRSEIFEFKLKCQDLADSITSFRGIGKVV